MTKPVAVFRSGVIGDPRNTARLDKNSHSVLFPSFSRYITSWAISSTWPAEAPWHLEVDATGRDRVCGWLLVAGCRLVAVSVGHRGSRPGRVGHSDPQRPSTGSIWRPISRWIGPLDRAVGVNPRFSSR
jgi:hypothetical protein